MRLRPWKPPNMLPRADFNHLALRSQIWTHGMMVTWEQSMVCPCRTMLALPTTTDEIITATPGEHRPDCDGCKGRGWIYHSPQPIPALVTRMDETPERFALFGVMAHAVASFTVQPETLPKYMDRFTLLTSVTLYELGRRRKATVDVLRYPIASRQSVEGAADDNLTTPVTTTRRVLYMRRADATGALLANELVDGVDFDVTEAGNIDWSKGVTLGTAPAVGSLYAFCAYIHPRYVVESKPHTTRDTQLAIGLPGQAPKALSVNVMARLEWVPNS